jgi:hypothetical protein
LIALLKSGQKGFELGAVVGYFEMDEFVDEEIVDDVIRSTVEAV